MDLKGAVAIITGGSGVLGGRICHALADAGASVAVVHHHSQRVAVDVVRQLRENGVQAEAFQCDVTDPQQVESLVDQTLERFGRTDILINDAAYNKWVPFSDLEQLTYELWNNIIDVNLTGPMLCIKAVAKEMKKRGGGRIVNISSVAGFGPTGSSIAYAVAKAGLNHLTKCMAVALAPDILVNCVAPGFLEGTKMTKNLDPEYRARASKNSLLQRAADKDDVARQVVAFCSTDSITGQTLVVDAGRVFH